MISGDLPFIYFLAGVCSRTDAVGRSGSGGVALHNRSRNNFVSGNRNSAINTLVTFRLSYLIVVVGIEVEVRHELSLNIINCLGQCLQELVEIFFVQEDLVPVVPVFIE